MRLKAFYLPCLILCVATLMMQAQSATDPLSGTWTGTWGPTPTHRNAVTVELKWDAKTLTLKGAVNPGPNAVKLQKTSFDPKSGAVHLEADAGSMGKMIHYIIEGKVGTGILIGSWNHDNRKGDFKLTKK